MPGSRRRVDDTYHCQLCCPSQLHNLGMFCPSSAALMHTSIRMCGIIISTVTMELKDIYAGISPPADKWMIRILIYPGYAALAYPIYAFSFQHTHAGSPSLPVTMDSRTIYAREKEDGACTVAPIAPIPGIIPWSPAWTMFL